MNVRFQDVSGQSDSKGDNVSREADQAWTKNIDKLHAKVGRMKPNHSPTAFKYH